MEHLPPVADTKSSHHPRWAQASNFSDKCDHWNKILKLSEYTLAIGARVTGNEFLGETAGICKEFRPGLLFPRANRKFEQAFVDDLPISMGPLADYSLRTTLLLLGVLYSLNLVDWVSRRLSHQSPFLGRCAAHLQPARFWAAVAVGFSGMFSGSVGMYKATELRKEVEKIGTSLDNSKFTSEEVAASRKALGIAFWVNFYGGTQALFELAQGVLPVWAGYTSRDLYLGLGFTGAFCSFMKGWVANERPRQRVV